MSRKLLWDPTYLTSNFALYTPSEIRLLQWNDTHIKTLAVASDLPLLKALAWSPSQSRDLFAAGLASGRTLLLRINADNEAPVNEPLHLVVASVNARVSRSVNAMAFSPAQSNLLAVGLDKARDYGLVLYDINSSEQRSASIRSSADVRISAQYGSGESVSSLLFLGNSSNPLLVASMGTKWIRTAKAYDPRTRSSSVGAASNATQLIYNAKSATLAASTLYDHLFSATEESSVRVYDTRKTSDAVLAVSINDLVPLDRKPSPIVSTTWSNQNRGSLATVDANGLVLSWSLYGPTKPDQLEPEYTLLDAHGAGQLHRSPIAATFAYSPASRTPTIAAVSKDGIVDLLPLQTPSQLAWTRENQICKTFQDTIGHFARVQSEDVDYEEALEVEENTLGLDMPSVIRDRVHQGYSVDLATNVACTTGSLKDMWASLQQATRLYRMGGLAALDFAFGGVNTILSYEKSEHLTTAVKNLDLKSTIEAGTQLTPHRKLALVLCGSQYAHGDFQTFLDHDHPEQAAAHAFFSGNTELAIKALLKSPKADDSLKLLATALASTLTLTPVSKHSAFGELCSTLSSDLESPYLRAMFAYVGSGDWQDVLEEQGLSLLDKLAIALRFLPDEELIRFSDRVSKNAVAAGDLEGLIYTGLTPSGITLVQNFLDKTGDVQTAALLAAQFPPPQQDARLQRWIASYRSLLDQWELYIPRAKFDVARSAKHRAFVQSQRQAGKEAAAPLTEPQQTSGARLYIRCNYCNLTLSPNNSILSKGKRRSKASACPRCGKSFPRCSICLGAISVPDADSSDFVQAWTFCSLCKHGGHSDHLTAWFQSHRMCAVARCTCHCQAQ